MRGSHIHKTQPVHQASTAEETSAAEKCVLKKRDKNEKVRRRERTHKSNINQASKQGRKHDHFVWRNIRWLWLLKHVINAAKRLLKHFY
jgi:hypothetical protein